MRTVGLALLLSASIACSSSSPTTPTPTGATAVTPDSIDAVIVELADNGGKAIVASLLPPNSGDQTGVIKMSSNAGQTELCYALRYTGSMSRPTSLRIYRGTAGGPTAAQMTFGPDTPLYACSTSFSREFLRDIARYPEQYGVDVSVQSAVALQGRFEPLKQPYH